MSAVTSGSSSTNSYFDIMASSQGIKFHSKNLKYLQDIERMAKDLLGENCRIECDKDTSKVIASFKTGYSQQKIERSKVISEMKRQLDKLYNNDENEKSSESNSIESKSNAENTVKGI